MTVIYAATIGLSIGAAATVARRTGEKDPQGAATAAVQAIAIGLLVSALIGTIGAIYAPQLLRLMGASEEVLATGSTFARVMLGTSGTVLLLFLINAVFRGAGDATIAMRVLWFANAINITLGPCLIFGIGPFPELGVTGAAVGTSIGRGCGVLFQLYHLTRPGGRIRIRAADVGLDLSVMRTIVRLSGTAMFQNFISTASWIGLVRILTGFGSAAVAGNTIGIRIILFALLPSFGVSSAAATLVGQNLGAGKPERAEAAAWKAGLYNTFCLDGAKRIVLKIDVEGAEWDSLLSSPDQILQQIDQMAVEFHWMEDGNFRWVQDEKHLRVVQRLRQFFEVAHIHFNNASCIGDLAPFPSWAYEVLFVNKRLAVVEPWRAAGGTHPLDAPNNAAFADCQPKPPVASP